MLKKVVLAKIIDKAKDHIVEEYQDEFISYIQSDELKEELPNYISHLEALSKLNFEQLNTSTIDAEEVVLRNHYRRLMARLAPSLYSLACSLSRQQREE